MDTDDLTPMAHDILGLAFEAVDVLRSEIGASASQCKNEGEFLEKTLEIVEEVLEDPNEYIESWDYTDQVDGSEFSTKVQKVKDHIEKTMQTPIAERGVPFFEQ